MLSFYHVLIVATELMATFLLHTRRQLPRLFIQPMDYTIYAQDIIFDNRIRGTRTT